jgi:hypothetical protein
MSFKVYRSPDLRLKEEEHFHELKTQTAITNSDVDTERRIGSSFYRGLFSPSLQV